MEIIIFVIAVIVAIFAEATLGIKFNIPGIGIIIEVALIGSIIIYLIKHKK